MRTIVFPVTCAVTSLHPSDGFENKPHVGIGVGAGATTAVELRMFSMVSFQESFGRLNNGVVLRPPTSGASENLTNFFGMFIYISVWGVGGWNDNDAGQNNTKLFQQVSVLLGIPHTFL